jgi:hypothetical protein
VAEHIARPIIEANVTRVALADRSEPDLIVRSAAVSAPMVHDVDDVAVWWPDESLRTPADT